MATTRIATPPRVSRSKKSAKSPHEVQPNDPVLAQARAVRDTLQQLESGHIPKAGVKLPLFNKDGTDFANAPAPVRPAPEPAPTRRSTDSSLPDLERHRRKCTICNHPERESIEEAFLHWHSPDYIANEFKLEDGRYLRRHAHAVGLYALRRENYIFTLENLLERGDEIELTSAVYIKAVRAYACMCDRVRWSSPAIRVIGIRDSARAVQQLDVVEHSSSLPQAASINPARGTEPAPSNRLGKQDPLACSPSSLPEAAVNAPVTAKPAPPVLGAKSLNESTEFPVPSTSLPQAASNPPADPTPQSPLATSHSPLPSNRPSPRLETEPSDRKQRKEVDSNRPEFAK